MGWDRRVLPNDRDRDETFPWMGVLALILIIGGMLLIILLASGSSPDELSETVIRVLTS